MSEEVTGGRWRAGASTAWCLARRSPRSVTMCLGVALSLGALAAPAALGAATNVGIQPALQPYKLGARARASVSLHFYGGVEHVPAPLSSAVLRFPAGLSIDLSGIGICPRTQLRRHGSSGCPASALLGRGSATLIVRAGSQTLPESATVSLLRGPNQGGHPSFEVLSRGRTPLQQTTISSAVLLADSPPYGSKLVISVPPIPTLRYEPNASFSALSLTIGGTAGALDPIVIPRRCPAGGFAFAASFGFADHSTAQEAGRLPCP